MSTDMSIIETGGRPRKNRIGEAIGRLTVLGVAHLPEKRAAWICACECSAIVKVHSSNLARTKSCGCLKKDAQKVRNRTHGDTAGGRTAPEFHSWCAMRARCSNPNNADWAHYGGRGIRVCTEWLGFNGYTRFLFDMGRKPGAEYSIDRINVDAGYSKGNCRWASPSEQRANQRRMK